MRLTSLAQQISFAFRFKRKFQVHRSFWWNMPTVAGIWKCKSLRIKVDKRYPCSVEIAPSNDVIRRSLKKHRLLSHHRKFSSKWRRPLCDWRRWSAMSGRSCLCVSHWLVSHRYSSSRIVRVRSNISTTPTINRSSSWNWILDYKWNILAPKWSPMWIYQPVNYR